MRALLDTHVLLWMMMDESRLSPAARTIVDDPDSQLLLSAASVWEMAIKVQIGKLALDVDLDTFVRGAVEAGAVDELPILLSHARRVATLPPHHRDPFDRMLIAQAQAESVPIVTADGVMKLYGVPIVW
jgi:PIN domain nuclease of toxin-antitoxin system